MSDLIIERLIVLGMGAETPAIILNADSKGLVAARDRTTADKLSANGIEKVVLIGEKITSVEGAPDWQDQLRSVIPLSREKLFVYYVTPMQPLGLDLFAAELARLSNRVEWMNGTVVTTDLPTLADENLAGALQTVDVLALLENDYPVFSPALPVLIHIAGVKVNKDRFSRMLVQVYPPDHTIFALSARLDSKLPWRGIELTSLVSCIDFVSVLYIPPVATDSSLESFMQVIARLRAPDGCPWDRKQTHNSLRPYLLEEAYEALEQLDNNNMEGLREELGDLLLQIALHSQIASETNSFTITQVLQQINRKIVSRHPHVFGEVYVNDDKDVVQNWEKLKEIERAGNGKAEGNGLLDGIPQILPALSQAQSIQERAARVGFDWPEITPVLAKVLEELQEVNDARDEQERAHELGDLLFAVVNLVRWYKVDAESALRYTNTKFRRRFAHIEAEAKKAGRELQKMTLEEMDALWEASKKLDEH